MKFISDEKIEYTEPKTQTKYYGLFKMQDEYGNVVFQNQVNGLELVHIDNVRKIPKMISLDEMIKHCYNVAEEDGRLWANQYQIFQEAIKLMKNYNMFKEGVEFLDPRESNQ